MKHHPLGQTDLMVSEIGLGTWVFGGHQWGGSRQQDCLGAFKEALARGINCVDTAPIYGFGRAEELVGRALRGHRHKVILATKCGLVWKGRAVRHDLSRASITREVEASLRRLGTDYIDLYQCHWPDPATEIGETMEALVSLQRQKKIRYIGVCNFSRDLLEQAARYGPVVSWQGPYSLLNQSAEEVFSCCRQHRMGVLVYGALGGGVLSGKYSRPCQWAASDARTFFYPYYRGEAFGRAQKILEKLREVGYPNNQTAINWARSSPDVTTTLVGCRDARQVRDNVAAAKWNLSERLRQWLSR